MSYILTESILLLEPDEADRHRMAGYLSARGWRVEAARCAEEAVDLCARIRFGLGLIAWERSGAAVWSAIERLRSSLPEMDFILCGETADCEGLIAAMRRGVRDFLFKPLREEELEQSVDRWAEGRRNPQRNHEMMASLRSTVVELQRRIGAFETGAPAFSALIGTSEAMNRVRRAALDASCSRRPVLLKGEPGTGKERVARAIHAAGEQGKSEVFLKVSLPEIPRELHEEELFGCEAEGDGSGARTMPGRLDLAAEGTLMLKEPAALAPGVQRKLASALQRRRFRRAGGRQDIRLSARVILSMSQRAASEIPGRLHPDLGAAVEGQVIQIPALRDRIEDLPQLVRHFWNRQAAAGNGGSPSVTIDRDLLIDLLSRDWPENLHELEETLEEKACGNGFRDRDLIRLSAPITRFGSRSTENSVNGRSISGQNELPRVIDALKRTRWNQRAAARLLGMSYSSLRRRVAKYDLKDRWMEHASNGAGH